MQKVERRILLVMHLIIWSLLGYVISLYLSDPVSNFFFGFGWCALWVSVLRIAQR